MRFLVSTVVAALLCIVAAVCAFAGSDRGGREAPDLAVASDCADLAGALALPDLITVRPLDESRELVWMAHEQTFLLASADPWTASSTSITRGEPCGIGPTGRIGRIGVVGRVTEPYGGRWGAIGARSAPTWL